MEYVGGYFTVERNIVGATLWEMESKLGFRPGRLAQGEQWELLVRVAAEEVCRLDARQTYWPRR